MKTNGQFQYFSALRLFCTTVLLQFFSNFGDLFKGHGDVGLTLLRSVIALERLKGEQKLENIYKLSHMPKPECCDSLYMNRNEVCWAQRKL